MKNFNLYLAKQRFIKSMGLLLFTCSIFIGCEKDLKELVELSNDKGSLNEHDVTKLFQYVQHTSTDKVLIYLQGGPIFNLEIENALEPTHKSELQDFSIILAHQSQTLNPNILNSDLSSAQYILEYEKSVKMLDKIITYFKSQNKHVVVMGHSYGGFLIQHYLNLYENKADKCIIMGSRLDMPQILIDGQKNGLYYQFKNGLIPLLVKNEASDEEKMSERYKKELKEFLWTGKLAGFTTQYRFTELLKDKDLSKVIYIYSEEDEATGRLSLEQREFLTKKGVKHRMFTTRDDEDAGHSSMFLPNNFKTIVAMLRVN